MECFALDEDEEVQGLSFTIGDDSPHSNSSRDLDTVFEEEQITPESPSTIKVQMCRRVFISSCVRCMCALYVCVVCVRCMCALYVCVVCVRCMCALYVCVVCVRCMCACTQYAYAVVYLCLLFYASMPIHSLLP